MTDHHSPEAEQAILGSLLYDNGGLRRVPALEARHFFNPVHARLYGDIVELVGNGRVVDAITLKNKYAQDETLIEIGGIDYLAVLVDTAPSGEALSEYAALVIDLSKRRDLLDLSHKFTQDLKDTEDYDCVSVLDSHIDAICRVQRQGSGQQAFSATQDAVTALLSPDRPARIDTGWGAVDSITGFTRGGITLIGGRASMGKSAFLIEAAFNAARRGLRVDLFSMEMNRAQIAARALSSYMARTSIVNGMPDSIAYQNVFELDITDAQRSRIRLSGATGRVMRVTLKRLSRLKNS